MIRDLIKPIIESAPEEEKETQKSLYITLLL